VKQKTASGGLVQRQQGVHRAGAVRAVQALDDDLQSAGPARRRPPPAPAG
jgi:hypothetical protein